MKKVLCAICLMLVLLTSGCSGTNPNPIAKHQSGDKYLNYWGLKFEIQSIDKQIDVRREVKKAKVFSNLMRLTDIYLIYPALFIDLRDAEQIEIEALQARKQILVLILKTKEL